MHIKYLLIVTVTAVFAGMGCTLNDPNRIDKVRYSMAHDHAQKVLLQSGSKLNAFYDYDLMTFGRRHFDEDTRILHRYQLYDFVKKTDAHGPERFVIAYDYATRKTYLRSDLRSNENLTTLPAQ